MSSDINEGSRSKTRERKIAEGGTRRADDTWLHGVPDVGPVGATCMVPDSIPRNGGRILLTWRGI